MFSLQKYSESLCKNLPEDASDDTIRTNVMMRLQAFIIFQMDLM